MLLQLCNLRPTPCSYFALSFCTLPPKPKPPEAHGKAVQQLQHQHTLTNISHVSLASLASLAARASSVYALLLVEVPQLGFCLLSFRTTPHHSALIIPQPPSDLHPYVPFYSNSFALGPSQIE